MPDRVVALQLLSSYWLAVILPPIPAVLCFSVIYSNEHLTPSSSSSSAATTVQSPVLVPESNLQRGRKFGGYRIMPKPCKVTSSLGKQGYGICMFNYECTQKEGTIMGTCMDGFLYGACCKLPNGVSIPTMKTPSSTSTESLTTINFDKSSTIAKPQIYHSPAETVLLYKNGTVVQDVYRPDEFLNFTKEHAVMSNSDLYQQVIIIDTNKNDQSSISSYKPYYHNNDNKNNYYNNNFGSSTNYMESEIKNNNSVSIENIPISISPNQIFNLAMSVTTKQPMVGSGEGTSVSSHDRSSTTILSKPYTTTTSSRDPAVTKFGSASTSYDGGSNNIVYTRLKVTQPSSTVRTNTTPNSSDYKYTRVNSTFSFSYNSGNKYDQDENLIRVPTLSANSVHQNQKPQHQQQNGLQGNNSIDRIVWLLNETRLMLQPTTTTENGQFQSLYTWLSVQGNPNKVNVYASETKPLTHSIYNDGGTSKPNTVLPGSTIHHITGPSFHVTPEVKITPKPQLTIPDIVPTVIVLTPAYETHKKPSSTSSFTYSAASSSASNASGNIDNNNNNNNYHYTVPHKPPISKPTTIRIPPSVVTSTTERPVPSIFAGTKPQYTYSSTTTKPVSAGYISKPIYQPENNVDTRIKPTSSVQSSSSFSSSYTGATAGINRPVNPSSHFPLYNQPPHVSMVHSSASASSSSSSAMLPSVLQTTATVVTTAKPIIPSNSVASASEYIRKPTYASPSPVTAPIYPPSPTPSTLSTSSYFTTKPTGINHFGISMQQQQTLNGEILGYPPFYQGANVLLNSTEDLIAFPPVRDPNANFTATQQEKPVITSTTTFGDEEIDSEVTPQFIVDKTLEDKVHNFVEKIVQSLQGNFEDLEKVLITGGSPANNVTTGTNANKKPSTATKKPLSTKKPLPTSSSTEASVVRPLKTTLSSVSSTISVTTKPSKKPGLATSVLLFQPSSTQTILTFSSKKPTTRLPLSPLLEAGSTQVTTVSSEVSNGLYEGQNNIITTIRNTGISEESLKRECGIRPLARKNGRIVGGKGSTFGEWPWQVLVREATWLGLFTKNKCGGVLITNKYVITAAHCQPGFLANLVAVFGEYDISGEVESKRSISKNVRRVIVHRQYDAATFENDIALLELESPVQFDSHIVPICMPEDDDEFTGHMATVTGWGRLKYGGGVPSVLQEVQVPIIENRVCQEMFQTAGHTKVILNSFLCAGYANGQRDSCEGDSGGPLMMERNGRWTLVATVSHGIKCAAPYLPGVYMRTTYYKPWLQTITGVQ